ncbi:ATP-binding cassette sub-family C member 9-like [Saccoglossus kowalevskii]
MANDEVNMDWFCGTNYTTGTTGLELNLTNPCFVDFLVACIHTFGLIGASLILLILGCCTRLRQVNPKTLLIFPGHDTRWITFYIFWVVLLAAIGEGILSDISGLSTPTQPNLYVPTTLAFVMLMISMAYYHNMECWSCPSMCWFLVLYWTLALFGEVLKLMNLVKQGYGNFDILRFDIAVICAVIYGFYLLLEINIIRTKILGWCFTEPGYPLDLKKKEMYYYHRYTNLTSRVAFWWLNWLMILGYKKSLDMKDLGVLPDEHGTRFHYELFKNAYEKEKVRFQQ